MDITKDQIKEMIKEMIRSEDIKFYINNEGDSFHQSITTEIQVWVDGDCIQAHKDVAYLSNE